MRLERAIILTILNGMTYNEGIGLSRKGDIPLDFGAVHYTKEEMERSDYSFKRNKYAQTFLNIYKGQMGVGDRDSWSKKALPMEE